MDRPIFILFLLFAFSASCSHGVVSETKGSNGCVKWEKLTTDKKIKLMAADAEHLLCED